MTATPVYAPYVPTYATREPYITAHEYLAAPTGTDTTQLLPGASPNVNRDALAGVIDRASSVVDAYCYQVLAATAEVEVSPPTGWRIQALGPGRAVIRAALAMTPIVQVNAVYLGADPSTVSALPDLTGVWITEKVVTVPVGNTPTAVTSVDWGTTGTGRLWGRVEYVCGWTNTSLSVAATAGATSVTPTDVLGIYPGLQVTVYDDLFARTERVQVASTYIPGAVTVPLTSALTYDHNAGTPVSALPPAIRQATISLTSALIKRRGGESIVLSALMEEPARKTLGEPGVMDDIGIARDLLRRYRRAV